MANFTSFSALRALCLDLPSGHPASSAAVAQREATLTKPPRSLGRLEDLVAWLAQWQGHAPPRLKQVEILVFAGNHGVTKQGVSAYPSEVTVQMVANFAAGGAAINQLARAAAAKLRVIPLSLETPTADFTERPALTESEFIAAVTVGYDAVSPDSDLVCLGEMGIGNTTAAAAIAAALFGGGGARWAGRGTGVDEDGLARKRAVIDQALARPKPAIACCWKSSALCRFSISTCGSVKRLGLLWRSTSCARRSRAIPAWRPSPRRACRTNRLTTRSRKRRVKRAGNAWQRRTSDLAGSRPAYAVCRRGRARLPIAIRSPCRCPWSRRWRTR
jgi:hypothetical protein